MRRVRGNDRDTARFHFTRVIPTVMVGGAFESECSRMSLRADCTLVALFVGDRSAGRSRKLYHFEPLETCFTTPLLKIRGGVIEGIAEFDQHV